MGIGADHRVTNRVKGDLRAFFRLEQRFQDGGALDHVAQRLRHRIAIESTLDEVILSSVLNGQFCRFLIAQGAQYQDRNVGRRRIKLVECRDTPAVGQKHIDEYRSHALAAVSIILKSLERCRAGSDPVDLDGRIAGTQEKFLDFFGRRDMILYEKYRVGHRIAVDRSRPLLPI